MGKYRPIEGTELTQLQFVYSLYRCLKDDESLKPRLQSIGMWWRYKGLISNLYQMFDALWQTIEPAKRNRINTIWACQELRIVNTSAPVDPTGDMMIVPKSAIVHMAQAAQDAKCGICMGFHSQRRDCLFRRSMVELAIPDLRKHEKQSGKCMGQLFDWRI